MVTGGGIEAPRRDLSFSQTLSLYRYLGWKWAKGWRRDEPAGFEWSAPCPPFPYGLERYHPHRLQLIMALLGLQQLDRYALRKRALLADHSQRVLYTPFLDTAPFVVFVSEEALPWTRRRKPPYAMPLDPSVSLRPQQVIVHNKGFYDHRREARTSFLPAKSDTEHGGAEPTVHRNPDAKRVSEPGSEASLGWPWRRRRFCVAGSGCRHRAARREIVCIARHCHPRGRHPAVAGGTLFHSPISLRLYQHRNFGAYAFVYGAIVPIGAVGGSRVELPNS